MDSRLNSILAGGGGGRAVNRGGAGGGGKGCEPRRGEAVILRKDEGP